MNGTDKQVAWANQIIEAADERLKTVEANLQSIDSPFTAKALEYVLIQREHLHGLQSAAVIISNKFAFDDWMQMSTIEWPFDFTRAADLDFVSESAWTIAKESYNGATSERVQEIISRRRERMPE